MSGETEGKKEGGGRESERSVIRNKIKRMRQQTHCKQYITYVRMGNSSLGKLAQHILCIVPYRVNSCPIMGQISALVRISACN